jgi:hypothetical protein
MVSQPAKRLLLIQINKRSNLPFLRVTRGRPQQASQEQVNCARSRTMDLLPPILRSSDILQGQPDLAPDPRRSCVG